MVLTGGIASGKTAVSDRFSQLGVPVIDSDLIAREVVAPGAPALQEIAAEFGADMLMDDGRLDRRKMRQRVFQDDGARNRLESILHPKIFRSMQEAIDALQDVTYCVVVIPLYAERMKDTDFADYVLVVDVPRALQMARLVARDGIDEAMALAMVDAQAPRSERLALADRIIRNDGTLADLDQQVSQVHREILTLLNSRETGALPLSRETKENGTLP